ncbi:hypothetical protein DBP19_36460 [Streptomyces sp. CS090A]|uniref:hypothetical protein n=1 Tax=Streptomyces sp. CS090A TaxID=2162710 RepID=UPI000D50DD73|nr:hypothetical protein [Streptomyces sp. CS090A]PVC80634.1 hypothetical protein DBP19_36460 [Streptomyces sp. CS090A]
MTTTDTQATTPSTSTELRLRAERILARRITNGPAPTDTDLRRAEILTNLAKAAATAELAAAITAAA